MIYWGPFNSTYITWFSSNRPYGPPPSCPMDPNAGQHEASHKKKVTLCRNIVLYDDVASPTALMEEEEVVGKKAPRARSPKIRDQGW